MEFDAIQKEIALAIVGKKTTELRRCSSALLICFGERIQVRFSESRKGFRREYVFKIPYPFRISKSGTILFGSRDMTVPYIDTDEADFEYEMEEKSALNVLIKNFNEKYGSLTVTNVVIDTTGSLTVEFQDEIVLEAFVNGSLRTITYWGFGTYVPDGCHWLMMFNE